ncbi:MAG: hypothetical protein ABSC53_14885 [Bacteroidota bacterium]|jgi:hypothetical protein
MQLGYRYFFPTIILLSFLTGIVLGQNAPTITKVEPCTGYIRLSLDWTNVSASANYRYEVYRSSGGSDQFAIVGVVEQGSSYFDDQNDLYKTVDQFFKYKVIAVGSSGPQGVSNIMNVRYNTGASSAAKRTWGSIKAMFR